MDYIPKLYYEAADSVKAISWKTCPHRLMAYRVNMLIDESDFHLKRLFWFQRLLLPLGIAG